MKFLEGYDLRKSPLDCQIIQSCMCNCQCKTWYHFYVRTNSCVVARWHHLSMRSGALRLARCRLLVCVCMVWSALVECIQLTHSKRHDCSPVVDLPSTGPVVDTSTVDEASDVLGVDIVSLDQANEMTDISQTLQLPDGTVAVIRNLSQRLYQRKLLHLLTLARMMTYILVVTAQ